MSAFLLVLSLFGCGDGPADTDDLPPEGITLRVDCLGMVPVADYDNWSAHRWGTPHILRSDEGNLEGRRCDGYMNPGSWLGYEGGTMPGSALAIRVNGDIWRASSDLLVHVDQSAGDWYMLGGYYGTFVSDSGEVAQISGAIDMCDQTTHPECPYTIENVLPYKFEAATRVLSAWGEATACRAIIDPATGGLQVDMEAAVWNGINISQLFRTSCPQREDVDPDWYGNRMTFKAGGVTGPGAYGPFRVTNFDGTQLPSLEWRAPAIFVGQSNRIGMLNFYQVCGSPEPYVFKTMDWTNYDKEVGVDSQCSFEITDGDPGLVSIHCTEVMHDRTVPTEAPCSNPNIGCTPDCSFATATCGHDFEWEGDCDVVVRQ